ncbi:hypothetical protein EDC01DRAFT_74332 [Geopyxis carbonaria]|nr:hypothetical protein EDC01DRAFT_74332 [Geopyxis carbonaria]
MSIFRHARRASTQTNHTSSSLGSQHSNISNTNVNTYHSTPRSSIALSPEVETLQLIIGIDYGTSHSGAAYALCSARNALTVLNSVTIRSISDWPSRRVSQNRRTSDKVPSEIAFTPTETFYGFDIPYGPHVPPDIERLEWLKLMLEPQPKRQELANSIEVREMRETLQRLQKTPVDAVSEYLRWLWDNICKKIIELEGDENIFQKVDVTVVMTMPAVWSDKAQNNTLLAVEKAGIVSEGVTLKFTTEPEAAAILSIKDKVRTHQIGTDDCFMVVDAGGGTVDVVTYQIVNTEPLVLNEVVTGDGDLCGSVFIDLEFKNQLKGFLEDVWENLSERALHTIEDAWEYNIKRNYEPELCGSNNNHPWEIFLPGVADNERLGIKDGVLTIPASILSHSFDSIMPLVLRLISNQRIGLGKKRLLSKLKAILLVGGFGGSSYLKDRIKQEYPEDGPNTIQIWRNDNAGYWQSVAAGAVRCEMLGLGRVNPVNTRLCRLNYGTAYKIRFDPAVHRAEDKWECPHTGVTKATNQVQWFIRKGEEINANSHTLLENFSLLLDEQRDLHAERRSVMWTVCLVRSDQDAAPNYRNENVRNFVDIQCEIPIDVVRGVQPETSVDGRRKFWRMPIKVEISMGAVMLGFRCLINGNEVGKTTANYRDVLD